MTAATASATPLSLTGAIDISQPSGWLSAASSDAPTTSNIHGGDLAFQRWYRFKEAFSPQFVVDIVRSLGFRPVRCTDPFGGSGTTALTCQFLGIPSTTIEVNPFLVDLIEAKLTVYETDRLIAARAALAARVATEEPTRTGTRRKVSDFFPGAPNTFVEPGRDGRWVFDVAVATRLAAYRDVIDVLPELVHRRLFRVVLGAAVVAVSNVIISGKGRRYRREAARQRALPGDVDRLFEEGFQRALYDICRFRERRSAEYTLHRGDARSILPTCDETDLVLFSPPYPNSFDYTDIYNVELWTLGYLRTSADNRSLREATLRSHVQIKRDFGAGDLGSPTLSAALDELERVRDSLWNPHIPAMVRAYADDIRKVLAAARGILTARGRVVMVVGDSRYAGVRVDVPQIVADLAPSVGLVCDERRAVRAMRASAQQGGAFSLGESLVCLRPA